MKIKNLFLALIVAFTVSMPPSAANAGITGSAHDFSSEGWTGGEICIACHTPHNSIVQGPPGSSAPGVPLLWNHRLTKPPQFYQMYTSYTFDGSPEGAYQGPTKLCLSCHDGVMAIDSLGDGFGNSGTNFITGPAKLGTDLSNDHPVNFVYDTTLANSDGNLYDPVTQASGMGGTIKDDMLHNRGRLECNTCHDPHDKNSIGKMLIKSNVNSELCLTCHIK
ncbi:MAG: cytochrome c3 family protein [Deltaproteobacteria bacterium]|nr:cytochrome c3 family protein [Deltaproteobacteria bacterium]